VHGVILASVTDNSPHGYNLTFAFPMLLFIVIAGALYLVYSRPHKVPGHGPLRISSASVHEAAGAHAASASTTSGSVSEDENQATDAGPAADQPAAPGDSAAGTPPNKDEASE
jgi:hypothetical protein